MSFSPFWRKFQHMLAFLKTNELAFWGKIYRSIYNHNLELENKVILEHVYILL